MSGPAGLLVKLHALGLPDEATMGKTGSAEYAKISAAIKELVEAAREASATLGHIYHTTPLHPKLEQYAHDAYQRLDAAIDGVSPRDRVNACDHSWAVKLADGEPVRVCQSCGFVPPAPFTPGQDSEGGGNG